MPAIMKLAYPGVLGFTIFISIIEMIISAILVASYNRSSYPTTHIQNVTRYTLFVSLWTIVVGGFYVAASVVLSTSVIASIASNLAFIFLTWIFWLAAGASTANALGGALSCSNPTFAHCHQLLAMEAFAWINFIIFSFVLAGVAFMGFRSRKSGSGLTGALSA